MKFNIAQCLEQLDAALHKHFMKHNRYPDVVAFNNEIIEQVREHIVDGKYMGIDVYLINSGVVATSIMDFEQLEPRGYLAYDGEFYKVYKHPMRKWQHAEEMPKFFDLVYYPITGQVVETTVHVKALPYAIGKAFNERWEANNKTIQEGGNIDKQIIIDYVTAILCDEHGNPVGDAETIENNLPQNVIVGIFNAVMGSKEDAGKS